MNTAQICSLVRALLLSAGAVLVKKGVIDDAGLTSGVDSLIGLGLVLVPLVWSHFVHKGPTPPADAPKPPASGIALLMVGLFALGFLGLSTGCGTLDKTGPYAGDQVLYVADQTDVVAYKTLHAFVQFEYDNRAALAGHPEIKKAADEIRAHAPDIFAKYDQARKVYTNVRSPETQAVLAAIADQLKAEVTKATAFLFQAQTLITK